ncbi:MAG: thermonuclease family protein [Opitutaceae bacterium]|nr:thermonuclease family protein [Opitutaceae bacterium]
MPRAYTTLRQQVAGVLTSARQEVEAAWVRTYHETGRLIHEHVLRHAARADYGTMVIARLAEDTGTSRRVLYQCVQFYRSFPILHARAKLGWLQYRLLCEVGDLRERRQLAAEANRNRWSGRELEKKVRAANAVRAAGRLPPVGTPKPEGPVRLLRPRRGAADHYRVVARGPGLAVDAGFKLYRRLEDGSPPGLKAGMIVRWENGGFVPATDATAADLFTYRVKVGRVVDGDTLGVSVLLPGYEMDEKLRLRGLDCPELDTAAGRAAKDRTGELVTAATDIIVTTAKVDKYDRYLADVHLLQPNGEWLFLNNALLREGHAVPMGNEAMDEWVP